MRCDRCVASSSCACAASPCWVCCSCAAAEGNCARRTLRRCVRPTATTTTAFFPARDDAAPERAAGTCERQKSSALNKRALLLAAPGAGLDALLACFQMRDARSEWLAATPVDFLRLSQSWTPARLCRAGARLPHQARRSAKTSRAAGGDGALLRRTGSHEKSRAARRGHHFRSGPTYCSLGRGRRGGLAGGSGLRSCACCCFACCFDRTMRIVEIRRGEAVFHHRWGKKQQA